MKKIKLITSLTLLLASANVLAAQSLGKVTFLAVNDLAQVQVKAERRGNNIPECVTAGNEDRLVNDLNTEQGKAMYSLLLSAQAQGLEVRIGGKNNCNLRSGVETIQYVILEP